jgi:hypothetical protein
MRGTSFVRPIFLNASNGTVSLACRECSYPFARKATMNPSKLTSIAALLLLAGAAHAQAIRITVPDEVPLPVSTLSRAEVIADYHLWRLSGLQALNQGDRGPDTESPAYRQAQAKYAWLRASPQFPELVAELSRRPGTSVLAQRGDVGPRVASSASAIGGR